MIVIECERCGLHYTCKRYKENYPNIIGCSGDGKNEREEENESNDDL